MKSLKNLTKNKHGFTLAELLIAIFLLVVALLAIAGVFIAGASALKKGAIVAQASDLAYNEKVFIELYTFDELVDGLNPGISYPPSSLPSGNFFAKGYPKNVGAFVIECSKIIYSNDSSVNLLYIKLRTSNVSSNKASTLSRTEYEEVNLDVLIPRNKK